MAGVTGSSASVLEVAQTALSALRLPSFALADATRIRETDARYEPSIVKSIHLLFKGMNTLIKGLRSNTVSDSAEG